MVLRLYETNEARTDEKPIVETEEAGDSNSFSLLIFPSFDSFQIKRVSWLTLRIISWSWPNQWLVCKQWGLTRGNPSHHARRYQPAAIFGFVISAN